MCEKIRSIVLSRARVEELLGPIITSIGSEKGGEKGNAKILVTRVMDGSRWKTGVEEEAKRKSCW